MDRAASSVASLPVSDISPPPAYDDHHQPVSEVAREHFAKELSRAGSSSIDHCSNRGYLDFYATMRGEREPTFVPLGKLPVDQFRRSRVCPSFDGPVIGIEEAHRFVIWPLFKRSAWKAEIPRPPSDGEKFKFYRPVQVEGQTRSLPLMKSAKAIRLLSEEGAELFTYRCPQKFNVRSLPCGSLVLSSHKMLEVGHVTREGWVSKVQQEHDNLRIEVIEISGPGDQFLFLQREDNGTQKISLYEKEGEQWRVTPLPEQIKLTHSLLYSLGFRWKGELHLARISDDTAKTFGSCKVEIYRLSQERDPPVISFSLDQKDNDFGSIMSVRATPFGESLFLSFCDNYKIRRVEIKEGEPVRLCATTTVKKWNAATTHLYSVDWKGGSDDVYWVNHELISVRTLDASTLQATAPSAVPGNSEGRENSSANILARSRVVMLRVAAFYSLLLSLGLYIACARKTPQWKSWTALSIECGVVSCTTVIFQNPHMREGEMRPLAILVGSFAAFITALAGGCLLYYRIGWKYNLAYTVATMGFPLATWTLVPTFSWWSPNPTTIASNEALT